jgi:hypothetical protein
MWYMAFVLSGTAVRSETEQSDKVKRKKKSDKKKKPRGGVRQQSGTFIENRGCHFGGNIPRTKKALFLFKKKTEMCCSSIVCCPILETTKTKQYNPIRKGLTGSFAARSRN